MLKKKKRSMRTYKSYLKNYNNLSKSDFIEDMTAFLAKNSDVASFANNFFIKQKSDRFSRNIAGFFDDVSGCITS